MHVPYANFRAFQTRSPHLEVARGLVVKSLRLLHTRSAPNAVLASPLRKRSLSKRGGVDDPCLESKLPRIPPPLGIVFCPVTEARSPTTFGIIVIVRARYHPDRWTRSRAIQVKCKLAYVHKAIPRKPYDWKTVGCGSEHERRRRATWESSANNKHRLRRSKLRLRIVSSSVF